jgi:hypothetical protein
LVNAWLVYGGGGCVDDLILRQWKSMEYLTGQQKIKPVKNKVRLPCNRP